MAQEIKRIYFNVNKTFPTLMECFKEFLSTDKHTFITWYLRLTGMVDYTVPTDDIYLITTLRNYIDTESSREEIKSFQMKLAKNDGRFWVECIYLDDECLNIIAEGTFKEVLNVKSKY